jgi:hypothetical protein
MSQEDNNQIYELKLTARKIIEMVKDVRELQKNLNFFMNCNNSFILNEYINCGHSWSTCSGSSRRSGITRAKKTS